MRRILVFLALTLATLLAGAALAQDVGSLRQTHTDLPRNAADQKVLNIYFGAISAVQDACPSALEASLKQQNALAACAIFNPNEGMGSLLRSAAEAQFSPLTMTDKAHWTTPWTANPDFNTVRQLSYQDTTYYLTLDPGKGEARVIIFQ